MWQTNYGPVRRSWLPYLLIALLSVLATWFLPSVVSRYWGQSPVPLQTVQTTGGQTVFEAPQTAPLAKGIKRGTVKTTVVSRPVATYATETLPKEEQEKIPDAPIRGVDNVIRRPELTASSIVPPWRGETHVRSYLMGDGRTELTLDPQREKFFGLDLRRLELEAAVGVGGKQFEASAAWYPLRFGNLSVGARAEAWSDMNGTIQGAGMVRIRWEPFR